jgi:hypothetical protein
MVTHLEATLGIPSQAIELEADARIREARLPAGARQCFYQAGLLTIWEVQSQAATVVLIALVAFAPLALTVSLMFAWALIATVVYYHARLRGFPDVFDSSVRWPPSRPCHWPAWVVAAALAIVKAWLAGIQPFLYVKAFSGLMAGPVTGWRRRVGRGVVLMMGLVLFGATAAHHLLRKADLPEHMVLRLCCVGSFLNATYRVTLSALIIGALTRLQSVLG